MTWVARLHGGPADGEEREWPSCPPDPLLVPVFPRLSYRVDEPVEPEALTYSTARYDRRSFYSVDNVVEYDYHDPTFAGVVAVLRRRLDELMFDIFVDAGEAITEPQEPEEITADNMRALMERISEEQHFRVPDIPMFPYEMRAGIGGPVTARGFTTVDQHHYDFVPDNCWRCDAVEATTDVGLCDDCRDDLTGDEA